jgi:DNA-binding NarL/FixJ family response regulator
MRRVFITMKDKSHLIKKLRDTINNSENYRVTGTFHDLQKCRNKLKECKDEEEKCKDKECEIELALKTPHILLLGLAFCDGNIADFCTEIRRDYPGIKILLLTDDVECSITWHIIDNEKEAEGFIRKDALPEELIAGLDVVMNGDEYLGGKIRIQEAPQEAPPKWFIPLKKIILNLMNEACSNEEAIEKLSFMAGYINQCRTLLITDLFDKHPQALDDDTTDEYLKMLIESLLVKGYSNWEIAGKLNMSMDTVRIYRMGLIQKLGAKNSMMFAQRHVDDLVHFTHNDIRLLRLIAAGFTSKQIAEKLYLGTEAIHSRRQELMYKSGAKNTMELIMDAFRQGLIKMEDIDFLTQKE